MSLLNTLMGGGRHKKHRRSKRRKSRKGSRKGGSSGLVPLGLLGTLLALGPKKSRRKHGKRNRTRRRR
jgi:hypothetical protein